MENTDTKKRKLKRTFLTTSVVRITLSFRLRSVWLHMRNRQRANLFLHCLTLFDDNAQILQPELLINTLHYLRITYSYQVSGLKRTQDLSLPF